MRLTICLTAALALCACSKQAETPNAADNTAEVTNADANAATPAAFTINETHLGIYRPKSKQGDPGIDRRQRQLHRPGPAPSMSTTAPP